MIILPAVDLLDGQVVRLRQGKLEEKTVYPDPPLVIAKRWEEEGGTYLHVIDLNAAFTGRTANIETIKALVRAIDIPVQVGGGVRSIETARKLIEGGASRIVIGTQAVQEPEFLGQLVNLFGGDKIVVSVDTKEGKIAVKGWTEVTSIGVLDFTQKVEDAGVETIVFTDIATDGALTGPNFEELQSILEITECQVIASGGVASIQHIQQLAMLPGLYGAIIGKALYDGSLDLSEAVATANYVSDARGAV
ncbi:MAG: 1-(5-phosphoribosyl)-5-[(5-phosphoribosylamino)methylideneamino]imidazole-4-carboxamide isomerase [Verrucomicrobia bacterium]|nr:1-(5-phosphoribosyl)-5-[(5-phosphoribosylamino)methylideneamino]imidazole-4-carboxamide isomerase [Verrucomicrobiota bacterium]